MTSKKRFFFMLTLSMFFISFSMFIYLVITNTSLLIEISISSYYMLQLSLLMDLVSMTFSSTVFLISSLVMMYSIDYMKKDNENKFMIIMMMFITFMIILCFSANLLWLMVGWDGLGVTSFALIMFFQNWKSFNSALVTFMCNRVGDLFILSAIGWLTSINSIVSWSACSPWFLQLSIMITALSKSAQIPFSCWLPLAMAAPTPVSSLVHSSTLVTAGVFMMIRFSSMMSDSTLEILLLISSSTVILAGLSAMLEFDFKKIIALSTLSHIGLMMMFISIKDEWPALAHLITHSMFKSVLFMCAGSLIHSTNNIQDIRSINSINYNNNVIMTTSILSMMGMPFLSGFYSKELMLLSFSSSNLSFYFLLTFMMAIILTCAYSMRLTFYILKGKSVYYSHASKEHGFMFTPMFMGCVFSSLVGGLVMWDLLMVSNFYYDLCFNTYLKEMLLFSMIIGLLIGSKILMINIGKISLYLSSMFFISSFCFIFQKFLFKSSFNLLNLDVKGWTDYVISTNTNKALNNFKKVMNNAFNQPIKINNMMIKVCLFTVLSSIMLFVM